MAYQMTCPCGASIRAFDEEFVAAVNDHLASAHPGRTYPDDAIMLMSVKVPDRLLRRDADPQA